MHGKVYESVKMHGKMRKAGKIYREIFTHTINIINPIFS